MILQCPRCSSIIEWESKNKPNGPEHCSCNTFQYWKVLKEYPKYEKGFVRVYSYLGSQELHGPSWKEDPNAWEKIK